MRRLIYPAAVGLLAAAYVAAGRLGLVPAVAQDVVLLAVVALTTLVLAGAAAERRAVAARAARDLAERQAAEAALRERERVLAAVFDRTAVGIVLTDLTGQHVQANAWYLRLLDYNLEQLRHLTMADVTHPDDRERYQALLAELASGARDWVVVERRCRRRDGGDVWTHCITSTVPQDADQAAQLITLVEDITSRKLAEDELLTSRQVLRDLSRRLLASQEDERARLARELHDQVGQALTASRLMVQRLARPGERPGADPTVAEALAALDQATDLVRTLAFDLRPAMLDDLGLAAAVQAYCRRAADHAGLALDIVIGRVGRELPREVETACYRVLQEAVTNAIRHARARRIEVVMDADGPELTLEVRDDGCGFDADGRPAGLGLLGMRERAELTGGQLDITSRPGEGTTVRACFPLGATGRA